MTPRAGAQSPSLAALLSFVWPGLGQFYLGRIRAAVIFALPSLVAVLLLAYELRRGAIVFAAELFADRTVGLATIGILALLGAWRLVSIVHASLSARAGSRLRATDKAALAAMVALVVLTHLTGGYYLLSFSDAGAQVFDPLNAGLITQATAAPSPSAGLTSGPTTSAEPLATPAGDGRVTILLTGTSSGNSSHLYDSIMVVSYNPADNSVQMVSVPRDSASFPFYFGGVDSPSAKLNALPTYVRSGRIKSPDTPYTTLVKEVQYLVGIPINYYAVMNIDGFMAMIDKVGGIDIVNSVPIYDRTYDWLDGSPYGFSLSAGPQHLNGRTALAYVRSRHGAGDSDWKRASRQQQVLVVLVHKMAQPAQLLKLPALFKLLGTSLATDFPANEVADYVAWAQGVPSSHITQVVLGPPYTITGVSATNAANCLLNAKVAALSIQLFGTDSLWSGKPAPANTCP